MKRAISFDPNCFRYALGMAQNNRELVILVVKQNGRLLEFVSDELKQDKEIICLALEQNYFAIEHVPLELKNDKDIALKAVESGWFAIRYLPTEVILDNVDIAIAAVIQQSPSMAYLPKEMKYNKVVGMAAVRKSGIALQHLSPILREDMDIVLEAMNQNADALYYVNEKTHQSLYKYVKNQIKFYDTSLESFQASFLFALLSNYSLNVSSQSNDDVSSPCPLVKLNKLGRYHCFFAKKLIAEYAGVQVGSKYHMLSKVDSGLWMTDNNGAFKFRRFRY
jgi:hypothetical protein